MTPLLQQAREALQALIDSHAKEANFHEILAARKALTSLDAYEAMSEYDKAVEALAPYLPDGWYAQDEDGSLRTYSDKPRMINGGWLDRAFGGTDAIGTAHLSVPTCPDWRTSLREIRAGRVVPQGGSV